MPFQRSSVLPPMLYRWSTSDGLPGPRSVGIGSSKLAYSEMPCAMLSRQPELGFIGSWSHLTPSTTGLWVSSCAPTWVRIRTLSPM